MSTQAAGRDRLRLLIAGSGPMETELRAAAANLGIAAQVWFAGARGDIPAIMRAMDVFVLPSMNEGISNTVLEAMASGLPVIACRVGGNPELVQDGLTGRLYDDAVPNALADAMRDYVSDTDQARRHGTAARTRVVTVFGIDTMVAGYRKLYNKLLD